MGKTKRLASKKFLMIILVVVVAAVGWYFYSHNRNRSNLVNSKSAQTVTGTTSQPTTHQVPTGTATGSTAGQSGGVVDKNGQTGVTLPDPSLWVSSNSGNITLQLPSPNTTVQSGDTLAGLSKDKSVQFILTDSSVGLIAQGNLSVINGKFSGVLQFTPHSTSGKLEVYYANPSNGAEEDIVEINVAFN